MLLKIGKKEPVSVELHDYIIRLLVEDSNNGDKYKVYEVPLEKGMIENGEIVDELAFFELLKDSLDRWDLRRRPIRFFVPDQSVLMRPIDIPDEITESTLLGYVRMEIGNSIHLPFDNPVLDVYDADPADGKALLFAGPEQGIRQLATLYEDATLQPEAAEVRMLANGRFLSATGKLGRGTTLVADWFINGVSIGIFSGNELEFLRFQEISIAVSDWQSQEDVDSRVTFSYIGNELDYKNQLIDQVLEIGRIINFYQFSLYKGEKEVDEIIIMGDNTHLTYIKENVEEAQAQTLTLVDDDFIQRFYPNLNGRHAALVGLALKGEE